MGNGFKQLVSISNYFLKKHSLKNNIYILESIV